MLRGIRESIVGLENIMNQSGKKYYIEDQEIIIPDEERYWFAIYLTDNAILRIYACLDKIAQMCRCYFEHEENGGSLKIKRKCKCEEIMGENNCNFGNLLSYLNSNKKGRSSQIISLLNELNNNKSICSLREYRNTFTHRKHKLDQTVGIDPKVESNVLENSKIETNFIFGESLPSINWFRVEIVDANNAIVDFISKVQDIIFPRDFDIPVKKHDGF